MRTQVKGKKNEPGNLSVSEALEDYKIACLSREMSLLMRKEVLTGKAKFGIGGAGKEIPLIALAKQFKKGDYWAGYYRDQTAMLAKGLLTPSTYFSSLYGDPTNDPFTGGRQMNNHFSTPFLNEESEWLDQRGQYNVTSPLASLASNVPRALGLAMATKMYQTNEFLKDQTGFAKDGHEITICVVGDATTSEGVFFESINAAGVMQIPIAFVILDDGYGISVPSQYQTTKGDISKVLEGFQSNEDGPGLEIYRLKGWDYQQNVKIFKKGLMKMREDGRPAIFHVRECTQPQGHSTSGSHQRYKSKERLDWEAEFDCISKMKSWLIDHQGVTADELNEIEQLCAADARNGRDTAWALWEGPIVKDQQELLSILSDLEQKFPNYPWVENAISKLHGTAIVDRSYALSIAQEIAFRFHDKAIEASSLEHWISEQTDILSTSYNTKLFVDGNDSAINVRAVKAKYEVDAPLVNGFKVLNAYFDQLLKRDPRVYAFGEDVGQIGDVNQAFAGLQEKYGEDRVFDTGIREWSIVGQGIGMAMRGLRPIAEIQYLDYLPYAFSPLTDDLATLHYRSNGAQAAPAIIRTRGHRLEGIWHSGSPLGMLLHSMRGMHILVPRNMTQAAGMYNTLLQSKDPALVIECLNGYRKKERMPSNLDEYAVALGRPEILKEGEDVTVVSYGSTLHIVAAAVEQLKEFGISTELIDIQTLLPFDLEHQISMSLKKTNRIIFIDEDVPGGATSFMMHEVLEKQRGYYYLDAPPKTLTAKAHRPAYGNDGDYASKPNQEEIFRAIYNLVRENNPI